MNPADDFSRSYAEARGKFRAASRRRGLAAESVRLPGRAGVEGETLTIDASLLGPPGAPSLLVLTSATHGIEGYCGSGIQTALLRDDEFVAAALGAGVAVLFVHALNPYGFSHGRRVNEDNVDLNRNFRDFGSPPPENPAYAELHPLLIPDAWPPPGENDAAIAAYLAAHGERAFQAALSGGQYAFPRGMFYGGSEPTWSNRSLRAVLASHAPGTKRVGWIDFHTGLGAPGVGERIYNGRRDALALDRARGWWGAGVTSFYEGSSVSALITGVVCEAAYDAYPGAEVTALGLEFGTVALPQVFQALRADHWLHLHPEAPAPLRAGIRHAMRAAFYVESDAWIGQVSAQARDAALAAVRGLACG